MAFAAAGRIATVLLGALLLWAPDVPGQTPSRSAGPAASQETTFRGGIEMVALQVAVTDAQVRFVPGLNTDDFGVFEEGVRQTVTLFATASTPLDVMLLLDSSSSMSLRMEVAQAAAINFVRALRPGDRAAVVPFSQRARISQTLTEDLERVEAAIRDASPSGGTALHEAVYVALRELERVRRADGQLRRQALVVLTDGDDNSSHLSFDDVLDEARRRAVTVYTVVPPAVSSFVVNSRKRQLPLFDLRLLAQDTGGRAFAPARLEDLAGAYEEIAEELGHQYWLAYIPTGGTSEGFRHVTVRVETRPGLRARTRSGYYASTPRRLAPLGSD